jgi:1-acyl-sn-glycerol-3-phosphate acyltransferase
MFYYISKFVVSIYYYLFYRIKVSGREHIPKKGGFVLCSNHLSVNDPIVLGFSLNRPIHFLAKKEIFQNKFFGFVLKTLHAIPVNRENVDMATFKAVLSVLKGGNCVCIFAQGTRIKEIDAKSAKSGIALFALKADVPIIPVCISTNYKHFSKVYVNIGEPVLLDKYKDTKIKTEGLNEITENVMTKISELHVKGL